MATSSLLYTLCGLGTFLRNKCSILTKWGSPYLAISWSSHATRKWVHLGLWHWILFTLLHRPFFEHLNKTEYEFHRPHLMEKSHVCFPFRMFAWSSSRAACRATGGDLSLFPWLLSADSWVDKQRQEAAPDTVTNSTVRDTEQHNLQGTVLYLLLKWPLELNSALTAQFKT